MAKWNTTEYYRDYYWANRNKKTAYLRAYLAKRKAALIEMLGGSCVACGSEEDLQFDHIEPWNQDFRIGSRLGLQWDKVLEEAKKCQLLCQPCHAEKTSAEMKVAAAGGHGRRGKYVNGCRCPDCVYANSEYGRKWKARHPGYSTEWARRKVRDQKNA